MAEIYMMKWPDEVNRFSDSIDGTPTTERQTYIQWDEASLLMGAFRTGRFKRADLYLEKANGLKLEYTFTQSFAGISGSRPTTNLGIAEYDQHGYICKVELRPVERLENKFWRELVPQKDREIIDKEEIARRETMNDLNRTYGAGQTSIETIMMLDELCVVANKYTRKLAKFLRRETNLGPVLVRQNKQWQIEPLQSAGGVDARPIPWGHWVIYRDQAICIDILNEDGLSKFSFKQVALGEGRKIESKTVTLPRKIDYGLCKQLIYTRDFWQDLFSIYAVSLECSSNTLIGKSG